MLADFITFIVKHLVERPEEVQVLHEQENERDLYKLSVSPEDLGRVIGKEGRNIRALRTLLSSVSARQGHRSSLTIDSGGSADD